MMLKKLFYDRQEALYVDRFALESVEPGVQHFLPVIGHYGRGHGHDWNSLGGNFGS